MSNNSFLKIDILRNRRTEEEKRSNYFKSYRNVFQRGFLIGISFLLLILFASFYTYNNKKRIEKQINALELSVNRYNYLISQIKKDVVNVRGIVRFNNELAIAISGLKSGSALLTEISQIMPQEITLEEISLDENDLKLSGIAPYSNGVSMVNSFILRLKDSMFFEKDQIFLNEITTINPGIDGAKKYLIDFDIIAGLNNNIIQINKSKLEKLNSKGLARRIDLLRKAKLIK